MHNTYDVKYIIKPPQPCIQIIQIHKLRIRKLNTINVWIEIMRTKNHIILQICYIYNSL